MPRAYGCGSSIHRYFQEWTQAGFFEKIGALGLEQYDELKGISWEWQSVDGCMVKAPLALEAVGRNPTDRGKKGTKRSVLTDEKGIPLAAQLDGANRHDSKLLAVTLDSIVIARPEATEGVKQNLCLDAGYTGKEKEIEERGYTPSHPSPERRKERGENNPNFKARRWGIEVTHSFMNRFRKLLVRYEKALKMIWACFSLPVL